MITLRPTLSCVHFYKKAELSPLRALEVLDLLHKLCVYVCVCMCVCMCVCVCVCCVCPIAYVC